ncbi:MAG: PilT/PilU family type 4a pilus ATPase [Oscillospiraceae bacterium]|nr:PilT/PilU family type 4a pilus ATPase [Oscillospiraceae bacterium]
MSKILTLDEIITKAQRLRASDIHIVCGIPIRVRVDGKLHNLDTNIMTPEDCESYAQDLSPHYSDIAHIGEQDLAVGFADGTRCRVNLFRQQGYVSAAIRILNNHIPAFEELGLPAQIGGFTDFNQGIVLVTGETGSGKSTTLACLLDKINHTQGKHIITLEDPIEYLYTPDQCIINQREVGQDTRSYSDGLKSILREDPDVILIGEMRSLSTIETALIAAETGHLVFATLHTNSAADTVDRIVEVFPAEQQAQIRMQLSMCLQAVVCQQLLPHASGRGRVLATEVMTATPAIRNLIREGKTPQISNAIATSGAEGNHLMDSSLITLYRQRKISSDCAIKHAHDADYVRRSTLF